MMKSKNPNIRFEKMIKLSSQDYPIKGKRKVSGSVSGYISKKTRSHKIVNT